MDRKDLRALSRVRLSEARALLNAGLPDGAYYLAGYAVECALKACIARETQRYEFPEKKRVNASHTHDLADLVKVAELQDALQAAIKSDPAFRQYWSDVQSWSEQSRYGKHSEDSARELIQAVGDRNHGVMKLGQALWVNIDLDAGAEILRVVDQSGVKVSVALWVKLEEYSDWRLLMSSRQFDAVGRHRAAGMVFDALNAAGFPIEKTPTIFILPMTDPTVRALRRIFGKAKAAAGMRLGGQQIGSRWVEDAYVYRIS